MDISLHSKKKHQAVGYYLRIIRDLIRSPRMPFKKTLHYADLYCGDGTSTVKLTGEKYEPPLIKSLLGMAEKSGISLHCFLNDKDKLNIESMKENTKEYIQFIDEYACEDANLYYQKVLQKIPKDQFSIFLLDPSRHYHLKWSTIKGIAQHAHTYYYRGTKIRRPELIINFMTYTMLQSFRAKSYDSITESIGTDEWLKKVSEYKQLDPESPAIEKALLDTFIKQLENLGYKVPTPVKILNTSPPNTVYYLVWATNGNGYDIIQKRVIPYINKLMEKAQKNNEIEFKTAKNREKGLYPLSNWAPKIK